MTSSRFRRAFAKTTWRRWLDKLQLWDELLDYNEIDLLERRVRNLERQVADVRAQVK